MKKLWAILLFLPLILTVNAQSKKTKAKADKITTANLQAHIQYLASDQLEGRRAGTPGEALAMQYISNMFDKYKLTPKGDNGFIQEFEISEGKGFSSPDNFFSVNGTKLEQKTDYYPLSFSANVDAKGSVSPMLREENQIWFWNVADILEDNKKNPHFDMISEVRDEAQKDAKKGAKALIVYNSSVTADNILFDKMDTAQSVNIPVIIAGGLGAENVAEAINAVQPTGVDSKTKTDKTDGSNTKDLEKVKRFVKVAKSIHLRT